MFNFSSPSSVDSVVAGFNKMISDLEALESLHSEKVANDQAAIDAANKRIADNTAEAARAMAIKAKIAGLLTI